MVTPDIVDAPQLVGARLTADFADWPPVDTLDPRQFADLRDGLPTRVDLAEVRAKAAEQAQRLFALL